jgi:hypothetical protein
MACSSPVLAGAPPSPMPQRSSSHPLPALVLQLGSPPCRASLPLLGVPSARFQLRVRAPISHCRVPWCSGVISSVPALGFPFFHGARPAVELPCARVLLPCSRRRAAPCVHPWQNASPWSASDSLLLGQNSSSPSHRSSLFSHGHTVVGTGTSWSVHGRSLRRWCSAINPLRRAQSYPSHRARISSVSPPSSSLAKSSPCYRALRPRRVPSPSRSLSQTVCSNLLLLQQLDLAASRDGEEWS